VNCVKGKFVINAAMYLFKNLIMQRFLLPPNEARTVYIATINNKNLLHKVGLNNMEENWVLNCKPDELIVDGKCIKFDRIEKEVFELLRQRNRRTITIKGEQRLNTLHKSMKDHLKALDDAQRQFEASQSYLSKLMSWWSGSGSSSGSSNSSSSSSSSSTSGAASQKRKPAKKPKHRNVESSRYKRRTVKRRTHARHE